MQNLTLPVHIDSRASVACNLETEGELIDIRGRLISFCTFWLVRISRQLVFLLHISSLYSSFIVALP